LPCSESPSFATTPVFVSARNALSVRLRPKLIIFIAIAPPDQFTLTRMRR